MSGPPFGFGRGSSRERETLHSDLVLVLDRAILRIDFSILQGNRSKADQEAAFEVGASGVHWPNSKHNQSDGDFDMSNAADIMPYYDAEPHIRWPDRKHDHPLEYIRKLAKVLELQTVIFEEAGAIGVDLRWGGMFKSLFDTPHVELC